jgi:hypothetical protein
MIFTHTHLHKRQFGDAGEYLEMSLTGMLGLEGQGLIFVNDDHRLTEQAEHKRLLMRARFGALDELQQRNHTDCVINMSACRYLDTASPEWLFEVVARRCVINGLHDPIVEASEFTPKPPRSKDKALLASAAGMKNVPSDRTRASLCVDAPSARVQTIMSWLQKWRGEVTVAGYSTGGAEHYLDVEGPQEALDELPNYVLTSSQWDWKVGDEWQVEVSPTAGYVTEWTLNMLYQTGLNTY